MFEFLLLMMTRSDLMFVIKPSADYGIDVGVRMVAGLYKPNSRVEYTHLERLTTTTYDSFVNLQHGVRTTCPSDSA